VWLLVALFVASPFILRIFVVEAFKIPSGAMMPTLLVGDHVFVSKLAGAPASGDVIVFDFPERPEHAFIKRVVGVGGDRVEAIDGRPIINGKLVPHCHAGTYEHDGKLSELYVEFLGSEPHLTLFDAKLSERKCATDSDCTDGGQTCHAQVCGVYQGPFQVPPDEVWVFGDNRNNSHDSRSWNAGVGAGVPLSLYTGKAVYFWLRLAPDLPNIGPVHGALNVGARPIQAAVDQCVKAGPPT
jgi:signal peptidase I